MFKEIFHHTSKTTAQHCNCTRNMHLSQTFGAYGGRIHNAIPVYVSQSKITKTYGFVDIRIVVPLNLV